MEDEWLVRMELADALTEAGWDVIEAPTGEAALQLLEEKHHVDLLVTDIRLPGPVNGWEVAEKYRAAHAKIAVVYCSGNPVDKARQVQDSLFLSKPCRIDILLNATRQPRNGNHNNGTH